MAGSPLIESPGSDRSSEMKASERIPSIRPENHRLFRVLQSVMYVGFPAHTAFIPLFFSLGIPILGFFNILSSLSWLLAAWLNRRGHHSAAVHIVTVEVVLHSALATYCFGWGSGFQTYLMPMITFTMINNRMSRRMMVIQAAVLVALYAVLYLVTKNFPPQVDPKLIEIVQYVNIVVVFASLCVISYFFREASLESEQRMEELASTDMLTSIPNRRRMRELLEGERTRFGRSGRPFAVVLTDIDFFKRVNDEFGHDCGDHVLRTVAATLRSTVRDQDVVARWGGEEFLALLPETGHEGAIDAAERMRKAVADKKIDLDGREMSVTMTFGTAVAIQGEPLESTVTRADLGLYEGKRRGRNRVGIDSSSSDPPAALEEPTLEAMLESGQG